jgi:hypothetical protein
MIGQGASCAIAHSYQLLFEGFIERVRESMADLFSLVDSIALLDMLRSEEEGGGIICCQDSFPNCFYKLQLLC